MTTLSVIIATHHRSALLQRAIASLLSQTRPIHQIIVVSDVRDAQTYELATRLLRPCDLFLERGGQPGPSESRNVGLQMSTAEYFVFLDDDDTFLPDFAEAAMRNIEAAAHRNRVFYTDFEIVRDAPDDPSVIVGEIERSDIGANDVRLLYVKNYLPNNCVIYPKQLAGIISFDHRMAYEDWDFLLSAADRLPLQHLPMAGPRIHKIDSDGRVQRGAGNNDKLLQCYLDIYNKHRPREIEVATWRSNFFKNIGIDLSALMDIHALQGSETAAPQAASMRTLPVRAGRDRLDAFDAFQSGIVFTFWFGPYVMSPSRSAAVQSIFRDTGRPVMFVTDANVREFEHPDHLFHEAFQYLSEVHKADYLRCYLMHHYGGGYTDVKPVLRPWTSYFRTLDDSPALALGYPEVSATAVAQLPGELGAQLRLHYAELIGYCSMIFKRRTALTSQWMDGTHAKLDQILADLRAHPAQHPMDQRGVRLPSGAISEYPLQWTELGGNIFHPAILQFRQQVLKVPEITPQLHDYR